MTTYLPMHCPSKLHFLELYHLQNIHTVYKKIICTCKWWSRVKQIVLQSSTICTVPKLHTTVRYRPNVFTVASIILQVSQILQSVYQNYSQWRKTHGMYSIISILPTKLWRHNLAPKSLFCAEFPIYLWFVRSLPWKLDIASLSQWLNIVHARL